VKVRLIGRHPLLVRVVVWLVLPLLLGTAVLWLTLCRSLPQVQGQLVLSGLTAPVQVARDAAGVPHIRAASDADAFFALGYVHAQERMWQMDYKRRLGQGRLSEIAGVAALPSDKLMRTLGLAHAAEQALAELGSRERSALSAYARGVNAWIDSAPVLPPEFYVNGIRPARWNEADSLLMIKLLAFSLGANYRNELGNQVLVNHLGLTAASELVGAPLSWQGPQVDTRSRLAALADRLQTEHGIGGEGIGSNAWAVAGRHTRDGLPLLASDPHLAQQIPSGFFLVALDGDRLHVAGATLPGVPAVVFGHNANVAWGGTNLAADVQDLYVEHLALDGDNRYERDGAWQPLQVREETIRIAPAFPAMLRESYQPLRWQVRSTANGPLLSDVFGDREQPLSLRWSALDADDGSYASFLAINYASDITEFRSALNGYVAPALSFVVADRRGDIALYAAGRIPLRHGTAGTTPAPGWDSAYRWQRYLRADELPSIVNPPSGWIVSANQVIHDSAYPYLISNNWQPAYRSARIEALLAKATADGGKVGADDMQAMQRDVFDSEAGELLPFLRRQSGANEPQRAAIASLRSWDGSMQADSVGAAVYYVWSRHFMHRLVAVPLRVDLTQPQRLDSLNELASVFRPAFVRQVVQGPMAHWCGKGGAADCDSVARAALADTVDELRKLAGSSPAGWQWGVIHQSLFPHQPFGNHPLLAPLFDRRIAAEGGRYTVDVAGSEYSRDRGYVKQMGAVYRQVISLGEMEAARFSIDTGQSGNLLDRHYDDLLASHRANQLLPMQGAAVTTLQLLPAASH
jgi:penicillin amidase